jgi:hypothetical protein
MPHPWQLVLVCPDDDPELSAADIAAIEAACAQQDAERTSGVGERGRPCRCRRSFVDADTCVLCGHEAERVIDECAPHHGRH